VESALKEFWKSVKFWQISPRVWCLLFYGTRCIPMWLFILEFAKLQFSLVNVLWTNLLSIQLVRRASRHTSLHFAATDRNRTLYVRSTRAIVSFKRQRYGVEHSRQIATELFPKHRWTDWTEHLTVRAQPCSIEVFTTTTSTLSLCLICSGWYGTRSTDMMTDAKL